MQPDRCRFCGATEAEALLGAAMLWTGGRGHVEYVLCSDGYACQDRQDARDQAGESGQPAATRLTA